MAKQTQREYNPFGTLPRKRALADAADVSHVSQPSKQLDIQLSRNMSSAPAKSLAKSQDPAYTKFTTYVPVELHRSVKSKLVGQGRELSALVEELLRDWNARQ